MVKNVDKIKQHHNARREGHRPILQLFLAQISFLLQYEQSQCSKTIFKFELIMVEPLEVPLPNLIFLL